MCGWAGRIRNSWKWWMGFRRARRRSSRATRPIRKWTGSNSGNRARVANKSRLREKEGVCMIRMKHLEKTYRTDEVETLAIRDMSLDVNDGEFLAVMGPSGCGKSTLLNIVGMLDSPSGGEYWFGNQEIAGYSEGQLSALRKQAIGFVFQSFNLIDELNVSENVELALLYHEDVPASEIGR